MSCSSARCHSDLWWVLPGFSAGVRAWKSSDQGLNDQKSFKWLILSGSEFQIQSQNMFISEKKNDLGGRL